MPGTTLISSKTSGSASSDPSDELLTRLCFTKSKEGSCEARRIVDPSTMGIFCSRTVKEQWCWQSQTNRQSFDDGLVSFWRSQKEGILCSLKGEQESSLSDFSPSVQERGARLFPWKRRGFSLLITEGVYSKGWIVFIRLCWIEGSWRSQTHRRRIDDGKVMASHLQ